jgi:hypothetical protein
MLSNPSGSLPYLALRMHPLPLSPPPKYTVICRPKGVSLLSCTSGDIPSTKSGQESSPITRSLPALTAAITNNSSASRLAIIIPPPPPPLLLMPLDLRRFSTHRLTPTDLQLYPLQILPGYSTLSGGLKFMLFPNPLNEEILECSVMTIILSSLA